MSDPESTPASVVALYQQLAAERAGLARVAIAREPTVEGLFTSAVDDSHSAATDLGFDVVTRHFWQRLRMSG